VSSQARKLEVYPFVLLFSLSLSSSLCFYFFCMASALFPVHIWSFLLSDDSLPLLPPSFCFSTTPAGAYLGKSGTKLVKNPQWNATYSIHCLWALGPSSNSQGRESQWWSQHACLRMCCPEATDLLRPLTCAAPALVSTIRQSGVALPGK